MKNRAVLKYCSICNGTGFATFHYGDTKEEVITLCAKHFSAWSHEEPQVILGRERLTPEEHKAQFARVRDYTTRLRVV